MAKLFNLARMTTATAGTGTITLGAAVSGYLTFALAGVANGDVVDYAIKDGANSEHGTGTYTTAGPALTRTVTKSTNGNAAINLSGTAEVFISPRAETLNDASVITTGDVAAARMSANIMSAIGYVPVQLGTGVGQGSNLVKIGWSGTRVKVTIDSTDMGNVLFDSHIGSSVLAYSADVVYDNVATAFTAQQSATIGTITDGATITWTVGGAQKGRVTLAGNRTMAAVSGAVEGATYFLWVVQDGTGSRTLSWTTTGAGSFDLGAAGAPTLTTTLNKADLICFEAVTIAGTLKLRFMGIQKGFS